MIKDKSCSAYIIPVRNNMVAMLDYGNHNYGPIGGRLDDGEGFYDALRRELTEELGIESLKILNSITEIPTPYSFRHDNIARAEKRGAWAEEHHFFIAHVTDEIDLKFIENRVENISVVWLPIKDLLNPNVIIFDDMREFFAKYVINAI